MRLQIDVHLDYRFPEPADVLLQIEAAALPDQRIEAEALVVGSPEPLRAVPGEEGIGQRCLARGTGRLVADYRAVVTIERAAVDIAALPGTEVRDLPGHVVGYLLPSRYCEADLFEGFVHDRFGRPGAGGLEGGALATALRDWIERHITYASSGSPGTTTAAMTFASRRGICRDYAHLLVALARAAGIPARCVSVYAPGVDPPDFHAVAELWLDGAWHLVDGTGMASAADLVRVAVGRDATDIAFMTIFGRATMAHQQVRVVALG